MCSRITLTIATVCYNAEKDIKDTVESVIPFVNDGVEYVIIDGGSNDGTLDILLNYKNSISNIVSERDEGIYDAMNKAIKLAKGRWIIFINCGDLLLSVPSELYDENHFNMDCILGSVMVDDNKLIKAKVSPFIYIRNTIPHQGLFYNIEKNNIKFDTRYKIFADHDLNLKLYKRGFDYFIIDEVVAYHSLNGISVDKKKATKESFALRREHGGVFLLIVAFFFFKYEGIVKRIKSISKWLRR